MHPRQSLQLDVGVAPHEQDPQEHTARPRAHNPSQILDFDHHHPSYSSSSAGNSSSAAAPGLSKGLSRPLTHQEQEKISVLDRLKFFLATAPSRWNPSQNGANGGQQPQHHPHTPSHPALNRFLLPSQEFVTCVYWNELYHITGTDIVRALVFRFEAFGRPVRNLKKFEEGVFSDLRNLKPGTDACLEEPKSPFLDLLFKYQCIRTQKKQKVFYWFSVPHDRLFLDALERDLKREKMGMEPTTVVVGEPALSFVYDSTFKRSLYDQFVRAAGGKDGEGDLERALRGLSDVDHSNSSAAPGPSTRTSGGGTDDDADSSGISDAEGSGTVRSRAKGKDAPVFNMISLFEGSPTYKQRRKKANRPSPLAVGADGQQQNGQHPYGNGMGEVYGDNGGYLNLPAIALPGLPSSAPPDYELRGKYTREGVYPYDGGIHHAGPSNSFARDAKQEPVSAAEMFMAQARGELHPPHRHHSASVATNGHSAAGYANKRHSYAGSATPFEVPEGVVDPATVGVWYEGKFAGSGIGAASRAPSRAQSEHGMGRENVEGGRKSKAYGCPLAGCEKLFSSPEHLTKHLASHMTDNQRKTSDGGERSFDTMDVGEWINKGMDEEGSGSNQHSPSNVGDIEMGDNMASSSQANRGPMGAFVDPATNGGMEADLAAALANDPSAANLYEVELDGDLVEVSDEEGLVRVAPSPGSSTNGHSVEDDVYNERFNYGVPIPTRADPRRNSSYDGYGSSYDSAHSYYSADGIDMNHPTQTAPADWMRIPPSAGYAQRAPPSRQDSRSRPSTGNVFDLNVYDGAPGVSASAPSHKVAFDHGSLYPYAGASTGESGNNSVSPSYPNSLPHSSPAIPVHTLSMDSGLAGMSPGQSSMLLGSAAINASLNGGPVRRHRSMTPSLYSNGRHARPVSSSGNMTGRSSPGFGDFSVGYHPYGNRSSSALAGSAHSSPAAGYVGLPPARSDSRASNHVIRPGSAASMHSAYGGEVYRTESPTPYGGGVGVNGGMITDSPSAFAMDLPPMPASDSMFSAQAQAPQTQGMHISSMPPTVGFSGNQYLARGPMEYYAATC